ncbi:MAG TPA: CCA tRNA nucleotidyltransferase [candidate division WOR-3 bacterium]|uniref:CCA tRNA nucleotidyltransferase n=1 Tax=candidate division WOR-3 bacterium TaxID=2052148 RepID=A0A9C9EPA4_UNCW3|nr:CCA tRNA nucleotidyltransferase [candidate division WOR-3 bacterium]
MVKSKSSVKSKKKSVLNRTIDFFVNSSYRAYLVGGYVRDATLGLSPVDIDVMVEGDAVKAAKEMNAKLKGKLYVYKSFGTASIIIKDERIDLATARKEKYPSPAKLPRVSPSTISDDLNRRDFTINAMAISISKENFGEIFDPFNGLEDIKKGLIRVLHKNSFIDDPTRIFRALRYKNRFNFKLEKRTKTLINEAVEKRLIKHLTGQRILNEIKLIFEEPQYHAIVKDLSDMGIFRMRKKELEQLPLFGSYRMYFYLANLNLQGLPLTAEESKIIKEMKSMKNILPKLEKASRKSSLYRILSPLSEGVIRLIPSIRPGLKNKVSTFFRLKRIKPFITGKDLKRLKFKPGKRFKTLLDKMWELQLDGRFRTKKEAEKYLKTLKK